MPGMNGLETLQKVQSLIYDVPVIMISAGVDGDVIAELLRTGRSRYFLPNLFFSMWGHSKYVIRDETNH